MAKFSIERGTTSVILHVFIQDSAATNGAGKTGLAFNTANLACKYVRDGEVLSSAITLEDISTLGTYAAPTSNAHMRFKELNSASPNAGDYEIQLHNDWVNATDSRRSLVISMGGAAGMAPLRIEIQLDNVNGKLDEIINLISDIAVTGAALNKTSESAVVTTGSETGTYANTKLHNNVYHQVAAVGGIIDLYYQFDIGLDGVPVEVITHGRLHEGSPPSGGDSLDIYAYNWGGAVWDHISPFSSDFVGVANSTFANDTTKTAILFSEHVGTGVNDGKVRIRFYGTSLEANTEFYVDFIYLKYANPLTIAGIQNGLALAGESEAALVLARAELSSVPAANASIASKVTWLFEYFRNKKTLNKAALIETLFKEDASTTLGTATLADDGTTFTKGEMS